MAYARTRQSYGQETEGNFPAGLAPVDGFYAVCDANRQAGQRIRGVAGAASPESSVLWRKARNPVDRKFDRGWRRRAYVHYPDLP